MGSKSPNFSRSGLFNADSQASIANLLAESDEVSTSSSTLTAVPVSVGLSVNDSHSSNFPDKGAKLRAIIFLEDAINYRSIHHKTDLFSLKLYRWYHSTPVQCAVKIATFLLLMLAFLEDPSSLSWSSDPRRGQTRYIFPDGFTEGIEIVCLLILGLSGLIQGFISTHGNETKVSFFRKNPWLTGGYIVLVISIVDIIVSLCLGNAVYRIRVRRLFRPYFLAQNTTMLKKTLKAMWHTLPEIASVLTLLSLLLYFFTMLGMLVFHKKSVNGTAPHDDVFNNTEWKLYFNTVDTSLISLVVLLTTANNPDVMMPAYSENRLYAIYFIVFSLLGTFLVFNLLTAIIYNQFRGYFKCSMQTSYVRRYVALSAAHRALFRVSPDPESSLSSSTESESQMISLTVIQETIRHVSMASDLRRKLFIALNDLQELGNDEVDRQSFCALFQNIDSVIISSFPRMHGPVWSSKIMQTVQSVVLSRYFNMAGNLIVLANAILMTVEIAIHYEEAFQAVFSRLNIMNYVFVGYYCIEQTLKILSLGKRYIVKFNCLYDGTITICLLCIELVQLVQYGNNADQESYYSLSLWDCARIANILILLRLLRIIPNFKPMALVTGVMLDIIRSLKSFAGIIVIIYYVFAVIGMMAFENALSPPPGNSSISYACGTYEQLQYWANNFNDFASSLVVLWDVMVVNNWGVFLEAFKTGVNPWSQLYFVVWWLISSVVCINLFIALILDHFIAKWEDNVEDRIEMSRRGTIQSLFRKHLHEPSQEHVAEELEKHPCFCQGHE